MSATGLKRSFNRAGRVYGSSYNISNRNDQPLSNSWEGSSRRPLLEVPGSSNRLERPSSLMKGFQDLWRLLGSNYIQLLLAVVPFALLSGVVSCTPVARFTLNILAIIPLQSVTSTASEELGLVLGQIPGGLLNTILESATELTVGFIALGDNQIRLVEANIMGSILSNMLLLPGACLFVGGLKQQEQSLGGSIVSMLLFPTLASIMILIAPTALYSVMAGDPDQEHSPHEILSMGCAIVLLLIHTANLTFQLKTHADSLDAIDAMDEGDNINVWTAALSLPLTLILITVCAYNIVRSVPFIVAHSGLSPVFIGVVILPLLGNTADHFTAVVVTFQSTIDLALAYCIASIMRTVLFVTPVLVITSNAIGHHITLFFGRWETVAVLLATVLLAALLQRTTSSYLDGLLCLGFYSVVVIAGLP